MNCLHPVKIKYDDITKYNESYTTELFVPCGRCQACIFNNANEWRSRLEIEYENASSSYFVTLTYDDAKLPLGNCSDSLGNSFIAPVVCKRDIQLFLKRLRKSHPHSKIRYFIVSEYGPRTLRPHYHGILFGLPYKNTGGEKAIVDATKAIERSWLNGFVTIDKVTFGRIAYVTKYLSCVTDLPEYLPKPFRLMSTRPAIGSSYLDNASRLDWHRETLSCYLPDGKFKRRLPRYLRDKIFDDEMKSTIRENYLLENKGKLSSESVLSEKLGYNNVFSYKEDKINTFVRQFNNKYKKSRKEL